MFSSLILPKSKPNTSVGVDDSEGTKDRAQQKSNRIFLILIYGMINTIMCVPCLYGYAAVIFNNSAFQPDINALSKLVLFSSVVHQICFSIFSSLPFSIGQVQDAGLIFLSVMANKIANKMSNDATITREEIVSTTVVVLGVATSCLGLILVFMGKFRMADLVSYLPLPVVGGYLGFIGYFCVMAGVSLCIDEAMIVPSDWAYLLNLELLTLAIPGLIAGMCMVFISRKSTNDTNLPMFMVALPVMFYVFLYMTGYGTERARNGGWLGPVSQPIPPQSVFALIKLNQVHWSVLRDILPTWAGMVFVVSFSSCLDVAAISMDMGEALDVNNELMTVGISNCKLHDQ
jgi:SulP family sulfate permease